jgi:crotonobetainyl-CoA:carnitine CoA-transferase CaiB-like acyl-CoA transferase
VASAILVGLLARARGAGGQEMLTTMVNTGVHAMSAQAVDHPGSRPEPVPDPSMRGFHATYQIYDASDGCVFLAALGDRDWDGLVAALADEAPLAADARFATPHARVDHDDALREVLAAVFARRSKDDWERLLLKADVGCVAVTTDSIETVYWSEEFGRDSGYLVDVVHPTFDEHPRLAPLVRFSRSETRAGPGVLAGAHTDALLTELGYGPEAIADLRARQVIG